jgi:hypothetical protein
MCQSCEVVSINGTNCHEIGCPDAWIDYTKECKWCGREFKPEEKGQDFCDDGCYRSYNGYPEEFEEEEN